MKKRFFISICLLAAVFLAGWIAVGNIAVEITEFKIENEKIPSGFDGFRIAQVSDLHNAVLGIDNNKLIDKLKKTDCDIIVITGDMIDSRNTDVEIAVEFSKESVKIAPTYYVTGNHEARVRDDYELLKNGLIEVGVTVLENKAVEIEHNGDKISLIGLQDTGFDLMTGIDYLLKDAMPQTDNYKILLAHRPEYFEKYNGVNLIFSGHAHGGQVKLPFIGGIFAPGQGLFPKYYEGIYTENEMTMVVSRGVGNSLFPFRVNNNPEIVVVELNSKNEKNESVESVRMINVDGTLYYDTGYFSDLTPRCGTMDSELSKTADEFHVPKGSGESNFEASGYQNATSITKELLIDGGWAIFKKIDSYGEDLTRYEYSFKIKGRHPNAVRDSEYIILSHTMDITFDMITKYFFSSLLEDHMLDICVVFPESHDKWGIRMYADNVTDTSITLTVEQFGGEAEGELQTGSWYEIEKMNDGTWEKLEYLPHEYEVAWKSVAYMVPSFERTELEINWEHLYGKLSPGYYRIGKEIMDFKGTGDFETEMYYAEFTIEEE